MFSCANERKKSKTKHDEVNETRTVTASEDFENLVIVDSLGVTGADGVISFPLDSTTSVFMMGDSFLAPVRHKKRDVDSKMINNTFILVNENERTHDAQYNGAGDGYEKSGTIHVFMFRFLHGDKAWGFEFSGADYIRMDSETFEVLSQEDFPYSNMNQVHYGHSLLYQDDYTYIYGAWNAKDSTALHVARAKLNPDIKKLEGFEFFDGKSWTSDPVKSAPLGGIEQQVPEQFSVFKYDDLYVLLLQARELGNGNIFSYLSDSPTGPWRNEKLLYHTTEQENTEDQVFTYNAMAHPQYIKDDKLLVSYCVNSFEVSNIHEVNTDYYRPRFIWVPMEMILE